MRAEEPQAGRPEPRWLDADERQTWLAVAAGASLLSSALDAQLVRDAGINHFEYMVMAMLSERQERTMPMSALAVLANGSLSRLSHTVSRLEKRGWVVRRPDPANGRVTLARLTDSGYDKVVESAPGHVAAVRRFVFDPLTKAQQRSLGEAYRRILAALGEDAGA